MANRAKRSRDEDDSDYDPLDALFDQPILACGVGNKCKRAPGDDDDEGLHGSLAALAKRPKLRTFDVGNSSSPCSVSFLGDGLLSYADRRKQMAAEKAAK